MKMTCGSVLAATTSPRSVAEPPMSSTAKASAIGAKAVPKRDTVRPRNSSRKSRSTSGLRAARSTGNYAARSARALASLTFAESHAVERLMRASKACSSHGACRDRTGDLRLAKPALSQLS
jgi:hypothetical protein